MSCAIVIIYPGDGLERGALDFEKFVPASYCLEYTGTSRDMNNNILLFINNNMSIICRYTGDWIKKLLDFSGNKSMCNDRIHRIWITI